MKGRGSRPLGRREFLLAGAAFAGAALAGPLALAQESALELMMRGQRLNFQGRHQEALDVLQRALEQDPTSTFALSQIGVAYARLGRVAEAVEAFRKVLRQDPEELFARTWVDILTQRPVERREPESRRPPTPQEERANEEERQWLARLRERGGRGEAGNLAYRVERIVLDPGHGGFDSGAVGLKGLKEKDVVLDIGRQLKELFDRTPPLQVFLTRQGDYFLDLSERTTIANQYRADLFVSLHINANTDRSAHGTDTFYSSEKASSKEAERVAAFENSFARDLEAFKEKPGFIDIERILFRFEREHYWGQSGRFARILQRGIGGELGFLSRGVHSANFFVLRNARMPALLVEAGFISNPREEERLREPALRRRIAEALFKQIQGYRQATLQEPIPPGELRRMARRGSSKGAGPLGRLLAALAGRAKT